MPSQPEPSDPPAPSDLPGPADSEAQTGDGPGPAGDGETDDGTAGPRSSADFPVVAIGASAGGVEALQEFFESMPHDGGLCVVVVPHLDPTRPSLMAEILQLKTSVPVKQIEGDTPLETNRVFVIPPGKAMVCEGGVLKLREPTEPRGHRRPIDGFMYSLAEDVEFRAVGVVLSGTGTSGTAGLRAIKGHGGITFCQQPDSARFPDMPRHALAAGVVDRAMEVGEIARLLLEYAKHPYSIAGGDAEAGVEEKRVLGQILAHVHVRTGHEFQLYKKPTLLRRVRRRMGLRGVESMPGYLDVLRHDAGEIEALVEDLLINVTEFFRDPPAWESLRERVIGPLVQELAPQDEVRCWVPACATGEEAYSLAILLFEEADRQGKPLRFRVFATDASDQALEVARRAYYPSSIDRHVSADRLHRFFDRTDNGYSIKKQVREAIVVAPQNLLKDPPFSRMNVAICRNLLIYLERGAQGRVLSLLHFSLRENGVLFLGNSEGLDHRAELYDTIDKRWRIFRRVGPTRHDLVDFAMLGGAEAGSGRAPTPHRMARGAAAALRPHVADVAEKALAELFAPATVIVDRGHRAVYFHGDVSPYLSQPAGEPTRDLLKMTGDALRATVRAVMLSAIKHDAPASATAFVIDKSGDGRAGPLPRPIASLPPGDQAADSRAGGPADRSADGPDDQPAGQPAGRLDAGPQGRAAEPGAGGGRSGPGGFERVEVQATPLAESIFGAHLLAVSFHPVPPPSGAALHEAELPRDGDYEFELRTVREELQGAVGQLESSNEELKASNEEITSMNEELQSTNEELETSREELQSLNEELNTVNAQLQEKIGELEQTGDDLSNLLQSTDIATLFLDGEMRIKRFTPAVGELWEILPGDIGRPIGHLAAKAEDAGLEDDVRTVLARLQPREREVQATSAAGETRHFLRRVTPYRTQDDRIEGAVVTFSNVTELRRSNNEAAAARAYAEMIVDTIREPLLVLNSDFVVQSANTAFYEAFRTNADRTLGQMVYQLGSDEWDIPELRRLLGDVLPARKIIDGYEVTHTFPRIGERTMLLHARQMDEQQLILLAINDITEAKRLERERETHRAQAEADALAASEAKAANEAKDRFLATLSHELRTPLTPVLLASDHLCGRDDLPDDAAAAARLIRDNVRLEARLIDDMLDLTRIARGKLAVDLRPCDAHAVVAAAVRSAGADRAGDGVASVSVELAAGSHHIEADPPRLQQVVWNLLINALKFTPASGEVTLVTDNPKPGRWRLRVTDTGRGIDPARLGGIFNAFEQLGDGGGGEASRPRGLGLGLAIAQTIVRMHDGELFVESEGEGRGSTFTLVLPAIPAPHGGSEGGGGQSGRLRILLVEDNDATRKLMADLLVREGHDVTAAATAQAAVDAAREAYDAGRGRFDVLLSDYGLPDFDGVELVGRLEPWRPRRCVMLSGYGMESDVARSRDAGYDAHVTKPVELSRLVATLRG